MVNGIPLILFKDTKGLRLGNPLSPYLYVIGMEYLTRSMNELDSNKSFVHHPKHSKINITHMLFTNDMLLFGRDYPNFVKLLA